MTPLVKMLREASSEFYNMYGFYPERLHVSAGVARAIERLLAKSDNPPPRGEPMTVLGYEVLYMTKTQTHPAECWLSTERGGEVYAMQLLIEPHEVDAVQLQIPGEIILETD